MSAASAFSACEATVRRADPDRYFSALFAPAEKRPLLFALYAFNHELARIGDVVREPMMGEIRLQWWRETVESARDGKPRDHDVARALTEVFRHVDLPRELFEAMLNARVFDLSPEPFADPATRDAYLDATSGNLMRLAARVLGANGAHGDLAREAGIAYGLAGLIRSKRFHRAKGKVFLRDDSMGSAMAHYSRAKGFPKPLSALAAFLPAALVPLYLKYGESDVPLYRKQLVFLRASVRGQI